MRQSGGNWLFFNVEPAKPSFPLHPALTRRAQVSWNGKVCVSTVALVSESDVCVWGANRERLGGWRALPCPALLWVHPCPRSPRDESLGHKRAALVVKMFPPLPCLRLPWQLAAIERADDVGMQSSVNATLPPPGFLEVWQWSQVALLLHATEQSKSDMSLASHILARPRRGGLKWCV